MAESWIDKAVDKGRIGEWIMVGGGIFVCVYGGIHHFLSGIQVVVIIQSLIAAIFGIENMLDKKKRK